MFDSALGAPAGEYFGVLLSYPGSSGSLDADYADIAAASKSSGAIVVATTDLLALTLLESPGSGALTLPSDRHNDSGATGIRRTACRFHGRA